jgi:holliday junction resolvase YEN1
MGNLGDSLLEAVWSRSLCDLAFFLVGWRIKLREELSTNASGHLARRQPSLARKVPTTFPNVNILLQYVKPITSWTEDTLPDSSHWTPGRLDIAKLASLCELFFTWGMASGIIRNFRKNIYAGACVQRLSLVVTFCFGDKL